MKVKSPAKQEIMDFVRQTKMGEDYQFEYAGTELEAHEFIKRMRTELSRLRTLVIQSGRKLSKFKVLVVSVTQTNETPPMTQVVLRKSDNGMRELSEYLDDEIIAELTGESANG